MPRFSVIIPAFDAAATLPATLASLHRQTCTDWEALVVDDGSTDATRAIAAAAGPRVRLLANPEKGPSAARNHGAVQAQADILAFLDADDLWAPEKLARMAEAFADPATDAAFAGIEFFRHRPGDSRVTSTVPPGPLRIGTLIGENPVCTLSNLCVRRAVFAASGGFDAKLVHNEDLEWLIRLAGQGARIIGLPERLVWYRTSPRGLSADHAAMREGRAAALATARRFGVLPDARAEAIHLRHLARRALRLDAGGLTALRLTAEGIATSPAGFLSPARRGALTALAALAAPALPRPVRRALFAR